MTEEDFLNSIYEQIPKNYSTLGTIMSCYIALGKRTNYMAEYFVAGENGDDYTQYNIYHSKKFILEDGKNIAICTSICRQLQALLDRFHISSTTEVDTRDPIALQDGLPHIFTIIHLPEYSFKIDLTKDLYRIQLGNQLRHFGSNPVNESNPYKTFSKTELYNIHKEINYLNSKGGYSNDAWISLRHILDTYGDIDSKEKLEFILREPIRFSVFSNLGPVERNHFYNSLFQNMPEQTWTEQIKKTYIKNRTLKGNGSYNTIYSIQDCNKQAHHYIQNGNSLEHFSNAELSTYMQENRIFTFSPLPFPKEQKEHD